jgi:CRISPR-associated endonuclease Csn1
MQLYRLLAEHGFLPSRYPERVQLLCAQSEPYALRAKGLKEKLEPWEFGRILCHINQRRGFLSPRDLMLFGTAKLNDELDLKEDPAEAKENDETGKIKSEIRRTRNSMEGFETIGAFLHHRLQNNLPVRKRKIQKGAKMVDDESRFVRSDRHMIQEEFDLLWNRQAPFHPLLTQHLKEQVEEIMFRQQIMTIRMSTRGKCLFYPKELRMPRAGLTAQKFTIAQEVASLKLFTDGGANQRTLTPEERSALVETLMGQEELSWKQVKEKLNISQFDRFNIESDPSKKERVEKPKGAPKGGGTKEKLRGSQTVFRIKRIIGEKWERLGAQAQRDLVGEIVSIRDWYEDRMPGRPPAAQRRRVVLMSKNLWTTTGEVHRE